MSLSLSVDYCAFMLAIVVVRYKVEVDKQVSPEDIASEVNLLWLGDDPRYNVDANTLHQAFHLFNTFYLRPARECAVFPKGSQIPPFHELPSVWNRREVKFSSGFISPLSEHPNNLIREGDEFELDEYCTYVLN